MMWYFFGWSAQLALISAVNRAANWRENEILTAGVASIWAAKNAPLAPPEITLKAPKIIEGFCARTTPAETHSSSWRSLNKMREARQRLSLSDFDRNLAADFYSAGFPTICLSMHLTGLTPTLGRKFCSAKLCCGEWKVRFSQISAGFQPNLCVIRLNT